MKCLTPACKSIGPVSVRPPVAGWLLLAWLLPLSAGCHDPAEQNAASQESATRTIQPALAIKPPETPVGPIRLSVEVKAHHFYRGERIEAAVTVRNVSDAPLRVPKFPFDPRCWGTMAVSLKGDHVQGVKALLPDCFFPTQLGPDDLVDIPAGGSRIFRLCLQENICLFPSQPDIYSLSAQLKHEGQWLSSPEVRFRLHELPPLDVFRKLEPAHQAQGKRASGPRAWVGTVPTEGTSRTLLAVTSFGAGNTGLEPSFSLRTYRLGSVSPQAKIEAEFVPTEDGGKIGNFHVLATEPDGSQLYHVADPQLVNPIRSEAFPETKVRFLRSEATGKVEIEIKQ